MRTLAERRDVEELRGRIAALTGEEAALWGRMSVGEMVCHVREAFRAVLEGRKMTPNQSALPARAMKWLALRSPMKWPPGVKTVRELEAGQPGIVGGDFARDRAEMLAELERFAVTETESAHPIFGPMRTADWMRWGYLHTDHHLRQFGR